MTEMKINMYKYEEELQDDGINLIAGVDEAGRGPLAGPVVVAACILPPTSRIDGLNDSKQLSKKKRETLYKEIIKQAIAYKIIFVSAQTKQRVHQILPTIDQVHDYSLMRIPTNVLNEVIMDAQLMTPPPTHNGKRLRIYYASQVSVGPPTFVLFVNDPELLHFSYKRFLENKLREAFNFTGTTLRIIARERQK